MKQITVVLSVFVLCLSAQALAAKEYTPEQLRKMVQAGKYPTQGPLNKEETVNMSWAACLARTEAIIGAVTPTYPAAKIVDTKVMTSTKVWLNDGATTVTCYGDGRLHITVAPYK